MTDRLHQALATAIADLEWFRVPHTVDQIAGLYSEALAGQTMRYRHGLSDQELIAEIHAGWDRTGMGKGGHSDPTADAALRGEPDAIDDTDGTLGAIDACLRTIGDAAVRLDQHASHHTGRTPATPPANHTHDPLARAFATARQTRIDHTLHQLRHAHAALTHAATLNPPPPIDHQLTEELIRIHIAQNTEWLRTKAEAIWTASHGEALPVAIQRPIVECRICGTWRRGTIATAAGRCEECSNFFRNHQCEATEPIVKRWSYNKSATPGQILEAKAASRKRRRSTAS